MTFRPIWSSKQQATDEMHKSAITDHVTRENHLMDWKGAKIVDKESDRQSRWIREAIWIRRAAPVMNRDEGGYQLSHLYDPLLCRKQQLPACFEKDGCQSSKRQQ